MEILSQNQIVVDRDKTKNSGSGHGEKKHGRYKKNEEKIQAKIL